MNKKLMGHSAKNGYRIEKYHEFDEFGEFVREYFLVYDPSGNFIGEFDNESDVEKAIDSDINSSFEM